MAMRAVSVGAISVSPDLLSGEGFPGTAGRGSSCRPSVSRVVSHVDPLMSMPTDVPARIVTQVGEQGVHAGLVLQVQEVKLGFAILLGDGIVGSDLHHSERVAALRNPEAHRGIITRVQEADERHHGQGKASHPPSHLLRHFPRRRARRVFRRSQLGVSSRVTLAEASSADLSYRSAAFRARQRVLARLTIASARHRA